MEWIDVTQTQNDNGRSMNVDTTDTPIDAYEFVMQVRSLSPVGHELGENLYRVPVHIENEQHTVYVGDNHTRIFDADTLPDFLKHKLAMIAVSNQGELFDDVQVTKLRLFVPRHGDLECIGWRASPSYYIVVMTYDELNSLKGST